MANKLEFETTNEEYTAHEFYEHYRDSFPQLSVVTQGYFGEIGIETFGRGQALRIFAFYTQKRVMASVYHERGHTRLDDKLLSFPFDGDTKFHYTTSDGKQVNKDRTIEEILQSGHIKLEEGNTVDLQFANAREAESVGLAFRNVDKTLHIRLFEEFEEIFLLGNPLIEGNVHSKVVEIPLYLPTMKMSLVTGIKGHDVIKWRQYKTEMRDAIERNARFDQIYGRKEIAVYSTDVLKTYRSYTFLPPTSYISKRPDDEGSTCRLSFTLEFIYETSLFDNVTQDNNKVEEINTEGIPVSTEGILMSPETSAKEIPVSGLDGEAQTVSMEEQHPESKVTEYKIEFDEDEEEMSVQEFYERFKKDLPKVVKVKQGYHGEIGIESFGQGQVIRIHTCSNQKRIIADILHGQSDLEGCQISIPVCYKTMFCIAKSPSIRGKREYTLTEILQKHKLPVEVKFANVEDSNVLRLGPRLRKSYHNIHLRLTDMHEDVYLLGNPISDGCLYARVMAVPVYLPDLKVCVLKGITGCSPASWVKYQKEMTETAEKHVDFTMDYGNENIAIYTNHASEQISNFTYTSPKVYCESENEDKDSIAEKARILRERQRQSTVCLYKPTALLGSELTNATENDKSVNEQTSCNSIKNGDSVITKDAEDSKTSLEEVDKNVCGNTVEKEKKVNEESTNESEVRYRIQFVHDETEYSARDFFESYKELLPQLVIVTQGHYGDIGMETFDKEQIIRVHKHSVQKRVKAEVLPGHRYLSGKIISIPFDYHLKFRILEENNTEIKSSNSMLLKEIIESYELPKTVQFDEVFEQTTCFVGQKRIHIDRFPNVKLVEVYDDFHLLGNPVSDGCLYSRVIDIPVNLPDVQLSIVTGTRTCSNENWNSYLSGMSQIVQEKIDFDGYCCNKEITFYTTIFTSSVSGSLDNSLDSNEIETKKSKDTLEMSDETEEQEKGRSIGLLTEVLAAAYGRRPESICLYEPFLLTIDMNIVHSKGRESSTDILESDTVVASTRDQENTWSDTKIETPKFFL